MPLADRDAHDPSAYYAKLTGSGSDLEVRCSLALREAALLIELDRLVEVAARFVALHAAAAGALSDESFEAGISTAVRFVLDEDRTRAFSDGRLPFEDYEFLERDYFVPDGEGARSAHAFNTLPFATRRDTLNLLVLAIPLDECARIADEKDHMPVVDRARTGILTIMRIDEETFMKETTKRHRKKT